MWLLAAIALAPGIPSIYVATDGEDSWSGRLRRPNHARTDGPVASLDCAQRCAMKVPTSDVVVEAGRYRVERPITLEPGFHGQITAEAPNKVTFDGARRITGWKVDQKGWWHTTLPEVASGKWNFIQLWVNGERRYRARSTGDGYATIAAAAPPTLDVTGKGYNRFVYAAGDIRPEWQNLGDVEILAVHNWSMGRLRIASVDPSTRTVTMAGHSAANADWSAFPKGNHFIVENVKEALGRPGDWYLDRPTGELTYVPERGEGPKDADVEAPIAPGLVTGSGLSLTILSGIRFEHTNWVTPPTGHDFPQADIDTGAALEFSNCANVRLYGCAISGTGGYGVRFGGGCSYCRISGSTLRDLGAVGVMIGTTPSEAHTEKCVVAGCLLISGGRLHPAGVGVWIGDSSDNAVTGCEIRDFYYTGISVGWTWGYGAARSGRNAIESNIIYDIGQNVLSDMGGIYTLGDQTGTVLRGNRIHDVNCYAYGGWGIYPDEGSANELIEKNLVYRCSIAGFHQHYGKDNLVRNNIFALNGEFEVMRTRAENHRSFTFQHNVIAWKTGAPLGGNWSGTGFEMRNNLYWHYGSPTKAPAQEPDAVVADPTIIDPVHGPFEPTELAPARTAGIYWLNDFRWERVALNKQSSVRSAARAFPDPFAKTRQ